MTDYAYLLLGGNMGTWVKLSYNLIEEIEKATIANHNFDIDDWCLRDAETLEKAAAMIRSGLSSQHPHPSDGLFDPVCRVCGDPLTTDELICSDCRR